MKARNRLTDVHVARVDLVKRGATRDVSSPDEPARFLLFKADGTDDPPVFDDEWLERHLTGESTHVGPLDHPHAHDDGTVHTHAHTHSAGAVSHDTARHRSPRTVHPEVPTPPAGMVPAEAQRMGKAEAEAAASAAGWYADAYDAVLEKRDFDASVGGGVDRDRLDASTFALPEQRLYPIVTAADVSDAVHLVGQHPEAKAGIIRRAKAIGATSALPEDWLSKTDDDNAPAPAPASDTAGDTPMPETETTTQAVEKAEVPAELLERLAKAEADAKRAGELEARLAKAEELAKAERDTRVLREFVAKADSEMPNIPGDRAELAKAMMAVSDAMPEQYGVLETAMKAASEQIAAAKLFGERGSSAPGGLRPDGALAARVAKEAEEIAKAEGLGAAAARAAVWERHPDWYAEYRMERARSVPPVLHP